VTIWCWVRDLSTGHHFDVSLSALDHYEGIGAVREIPGRRIRAANPRRPKHFVDLSGRRVIPASRPDQPKE